MFDNIVIGVDRRQGGRDAIALGRKLQGRGGRLTLAHVYQGKGDTALLRRAPTADDESVRERGLDHLTAVGQRLGLAAALACVKAPTPARGLHRLARSGSADLLVVGSSRRGMIGRLMLGDDTRATLDRPPCAVAVAPAGYARRGALMREIGVGYDGSPESERALAAARELAAALHAKLSAFEAIALPNYVFVGSPEALERPLHATLGNARARIAALHAEPHAAYGRAPAELEVYGASLDLLVVGSHGYGPFARLVHGSTSQKLARTLRCPLLVITPQQRA